MRKPIVYVKYELKTYEKEKIRPSIANLESIRAKWKKYNTRLWAMIQDVYSWYSEAPFEV